MSQRRRLMGLGLQITLLSAAALVSACVTTPPLAPPTIAWSERRAALLQAVEHFSLSGRLAANDGKEGFSAGVQWRQQGDAARVQLSGPLGFGAAQVEQDGARLRITTGNGVTLDGSAAAAQLAMMLGFDPPLSSLRYWILGVTDPAMSAEQSLDPQQRLVWLQQGGWRVDYHDYTPVQRQWLPRSLTVTRDNLQLKLVVNGWQL